MPHLFLGNSSYPLQRFSCNHCWNISFRLAKIQEENA